MPLPTPNLDDRRFQEIVDQAKRMIPQYCPEWTDHNVSDPGVTMIELFAWMTEMLLYRVNQVPDKLYIKFLELIGVQLQPPRAARVPVTYYLSAPQPIEVTIPAETEVATVRTETSPAIVFTSAADLTIRPPVVAGAFTSSPSRSEGAGWIIHDLRRLELPGQRIALFPPAPAAGDAFYIALERDHSHHVLALLLDCETAGGAGIDPTSPPLEWQVWQSDLARWVRCEVEYDGTGGFNQSGEIILHLPAMAQAAIHGVRAYWLRCRLTEAQSGPNAYRVSPDIERFDAESRGGTVDARHAITVRDEALGRSEGTPGQTFQLLHTPLLARDAKRDYLIVEPPGEPPQHWIEVADFADSTPDNRHFTLDSQDGKLALGPALLQPDGGMYRFGTIPVRGSTLRFSRYQYGGGVAGNIPSGAISVLKTSIPYVARVINRAPAVGGRDAQPIEDAKLRAPQALRTRTRAVTADDYEYLACQLPDVARAYCLAPGEQPGDPGLPPPGQVVVLALPRAADPRGRITPEELILSAELRADILAYLGERCVLGSRLAVRAPRCIEVSVQATLRLSARGRAAPDADVRQRAEAALYGYLNPYTGGPDGAGWPFGRDLHVSEIYGLLQRVPEVEFVEDVRIGVSGERSGRDGQEPAPPRLSLPRDGIICSGPHELKISRAV